MLEQADPPIFYTSELDFQRGLTPFVDWFAGRRTAKLYEARFRTCASYLSIEGRPTVLDFYQFDTFDVFLSPEYARFANDPYMDDALAGASFTSTVYSYVDSHCKGAAPLTPVDADWISYIRFDRASELDRHTESRLERAFSEWQADGARTLRMVRRYRNHPTDTSDRPRFSLLVEWSRRPSGLDGLIEGLKRAAADATAISGFNGFRLYPWPEDPQLRHLAIDTLGLRGRSA